MLQNEFHRRIAMCIFGVLLSGFSAAMFQFSLFGMDPFQVFAHGLWSLTPLSYGLAYSIINAILLVFMILFNKRMIGLGTVINMFLLGYVVDGSNALFSRMFGEPSILVRVIFLLIALTLMSFASAVYFVADMGVSTYDWIALTLSERKNWKFRVCRVSTDVICVVGGIIAFALRDRSSILSFVGVGTILTAFCMGPFVQWFNEKIATPMRYGRK